jgi:hypothetical protein
MLLICHLSSDIIILITRLFQLNERRYVTMLTVEDATTIYPSLKQAYLYNIKTQIIEM